MATLEYRKELHRLTVWHLQPNTCKRVGEGHMTTWLRISRGRSDSEAPIICVTTIKWAETNLNGTPINGNTEWRRHHADVNFGYILAIRSSITTLWQNLLICVKVCSCCENKYVKTPTVRKPTVMVDCPPHKPLFTFGVIADIQYADIDDGYNYLRTHRRYYRNSIELLRNALDSWSKAAVKPGFILQLGDLIDGYNKPLVASDRALEAVLKELGSGSADVHHVWGNHEFYNFSRDWLLSSKLNSTPQGSQKGAGSQVYAYHFSPYPGFTFIVLDAYDVAVLGREESSQGCQEALRLLRHYNKNEDLNTPPGTMANFISLYAFGFYTTQALSCCLSCKVDASFPL